MPRLPQAHEPLDARRVRRHRALLPGTRDTSGRRCASRRPRRSCGSWALSLAPGPSANPGSTNKTAAGFFRLGFSPELQPHRKTPAAMAHTVTQGSGGWRSPWGATACRLIRQCQKRSPRITRSSKRVHGLDAWLEISQPHPPAWQPLMPLGFASRCLSMCLTSPACLAQRPLHTSWPRPEHLLG